jgi:hypothetical protein
VSASRAAPPGQIFSRDAEEVQAVAQDDLRRLGEPHAGPVEVGRLVVAHRQDATVGVEAVILLRHVLKVVRHLVDVTQTGSLCDHARELRQRRQQVLLAPVGEQFRLEILGGALVETELGCVALDRGHPGVRVLDVPDRVLRTVGRQQVHIQDELVIGRRPRQRVPRRVHADHLDHVVQRDDVPGPLGELDLLAVLHHLHELADQDLDVLVRVVAGARGHRLEPADVAVVVGAEHVDARRETAVALVEVVRAVCGEVGAFSVGADDDPVLVIAEVGGPQPDRPVLLEDVALLGEPVGDALDRAGVVERLLGEPDVEVRAEALQRLLLEPELELVAGGPEGLDLRLLRHHGQDRVLLHDLRGQILDVRTLIQALALRHVLAVGPQRQRHAEVVHLVAGVVDVELARDVGAGRFQQPAQGVADGGPPGVAQVQRARRVGGDELQVDVLAGEGLAAAVRLALLDDALGQFARGPGGQAQVEETGPGYVDPGDAVHPAQTLGEQLGQGARRHAGGLGQLEGDVGGVVAVVAVLRSLDGHGLENRGQGQRTLGDGGVDGVEDGLGKLLGSHPDKVTGIREGVFLYRTRPGPARHPPTLLVRRAW